MYILVSVVNIQDGDDANSVPHLRGEWNHQRFVPRHEYQLLASDTDGRSFILYVRAVETVPATGYRNESLNKCDTMQTFITTMSSHSVNYIYSCVNM